MRLFIAIEISEDIKEALHNTQTSIGNDLSKIKWVNKNQMHLTLKFLGDAVSNSILAINGRLTKIKFKPFYLELDRIGVFPSEDYVRVVWVGVKPADKIISLQQEIENTLDGLFKKERSFHPHITLGRVKFVKDKKGFVSRLKSVNIENKKIEVSKFKLIKSTLAKEGPIYEDLGSFGQF